MYLFELSLSESAYALRALASNVLNAKYLAFSTPNTKNYIHKMCQIWYLLWYRSNNRIVWTSMLSIF